MRFLSYLVSMARPLRIEYPDAWYHVTSRGNERRDIFKDDSDRTRFLAILANSADTRPSLLTQTTTFWN